MSTCGTVLVVGYTILSEAEAIVQYAFFDTNKLNIGGGDGLL